MWDLVGNPEDRFSHNEAHLDKSSSIINLKSIGGYFFIFISFFDEIHKTNRIAPDGMTCFAASHLGLLCLRMSHKKDVRLI